MDQRHKTKYTPKVWRRNNFGNIFNKLNHGWIMSYSTEGWKGVNWIRQDTCTRYKQSEAIILPNLLTTWVKYLSAYVEREVLRLVS